MDGCNRLRADIALGSRGEGAIKISFVVVAVAAATLLFVSTPIFAYDEPDNFAGVKFGQDVTTQLPNCRDVIAGLDKKPCWEELTKGQRGYLKNVGEIEKLVESISYRQIDNKLETVLLNFRSEKAIALLDILKTRYGAPTSIGEDPWQSKGGIKTTSIHAEWIGSNVSIYFEGRGSSIDRGYIAYMTATMESTIRRDVEEQRKKAAGGL